MDGFMRLKKYTQYLQVCIWDRPNFAQLHLNISYKCLIVSFVCFFHVLMHSPREFAVRNFHIKILNGNGIMFLYWKTQLSINTLRTSKSRDNYCYLYIYMYTSFGTRLGINNDNYNFYIFTMRFAVSSNISLT